MKSLKSLFSFFVIIVLMLSLANISFAADSTVLLSVNGKTITKNTTIDDLHAMYGAEKLKTDSIFGGYAYSFYGEDYSDYLYIATNSSGKVAEYCVFGNDFISNAGNAGDKDSYTFSYLSGDVYTDYDGLIWGTTGYCTENIADKKAPSDLYDSDAKYAEYIARHASLMWNAVAKFFGKDTDIKFDSRTFYMNRQLMDGKSSFYYYCNNTGKREQFKLITCGVLPYMLQRGAYYPNPGMYAEYARSYTIPSDAYPVFDCNESGGYIVGSLRGTFYSDWNYVPYTAQECTLLANARQTYMQGVEAYNSSSDYFIVHPQDETLPLEPGQIAENKLRGALGYINAIRAGADLPLLELSEELSRGCQYKAILTSYLSKNRIDNPSPHFPPKVDGISDEYYDIAQMSAGENLYHGDVITSITNALNDAYGDPVTCGHRYNLLSPSWKYIGFGSTEVAGKLSIHIQGVHKMSGQQPYDAQIIAWPSKGVMLEEAGAGSNTMYTATFAKDYSMTDDTGVVFKCLNTDETFEFKAGEKNTREHELYNNGSIISYYDANISMTVGNVYEITLTNVKDRSSGEITDYKYRSVYESAYNSDTAGSADDLSISDSAVNLALNERRKISASIIPEDCANKMVIWASDNPEVATVNENGYVTAHKSGTATISAKTDNNIVKYCTVNVQKTPFTDLTSKWYIPFVEKAYENGIMNGMTPSTFEPASSMSRAMFVKVLANLEGLSFDNTVPTVFSDVQVGRYYTGPVAWASKNGVVNGVSPTEFAPNNPVTREQMCAMLIRYAEYKNIKLDQSVTPVTFDDENKISNYAKEYVKICQRAGIISGMTPTTFEPKGNATRAQVAKIFSVFYDYL